MKAKLFSLVSCLMLATTNFISYADNNETEILLYEIIETGTINDDDIFGSPKQEEYVPTHPNQFHATIAKRTLVVSVDNSNLTTVIVRTYGGVSVVNQQFISYNAMQLGTTGSYTIEIHNGTLTLVGQFDVH